MLQDVKKMQWGRRIDVFVLPEKKTRPPGHVKRSGCVVSQTPSMLLSAKFRTVIWMKHENVVATTWHMNIVRGGIFM